MAEIPRLGTSRLLRWVLEKVFDEGAGAIRTTATIASASVNVDLDATNPDGDSVQIYGLNAGTPTPVKVNAAGELVVDTEGGDYKSTVTKFDTKSDATYKEFLLPANCSEAVVVNEALGYELFVDPNDGGIAPVNDDGAVRLMQRTEAAGKTTFIDERAFDVAGLTRLWIRDDDGVSGHAIKIVCKVKV